MNEIVLKGIPAASGIAYGPAFILDKGEFIVAERVILNHEVDSEIARFEEAVHNACHEIHFLKEKIKQDLGEKHGQIFDAYLLILDDPELFQEVAEGIRQTRHAAEYVFSRIIKQHTQSFSKIEDEYLRERAGDLSDIARRVLKHLMDESKLHDLDNLQNDLVIVAHDLSPSDAVNLYNKKIMAFVTDIGGPTSHTAIIAKSLRVPAVVGLKDSTLRITNDDYLIIDGQKGLVIIHPTPETKELYTKECSQIHASLKQLDDLKGLPTQTLDGRKIPLLMNVGLTNEVALVKRVGAEGVGLYRTEFLYMNRLDLPTQEEQYRAYKQAVEMVSPYPVTVRTLDIGGDKFISSMQMPKEMSPSLGTRAIRFCLECPDIFKTQLRAILRASVHGRMQLMYPMISSIEELRQANAILNEVKNNLHEEKIPFDTHIKVGVMIEVPSAVLTADLLAKETDFFSIGTNDLIQYTLAVERINEKVAYLYDPSHPAILRMIQKTVEAAHHEGIPVGICGEMASDPVMALLLIGLKIDELSMSSSAILTIKKMIRSLRFRDIQSICRKAIKLTTSQEIQEFVLLQLEKLGLS